MKRLLTISVFVLISGVLSIFAQEEGLQVELLEESIVGLAVYPDGETPVVDMPVRVWSVDKKEIIYRSRTDANGNFSIPKLDSGQNYLFVGRVRVNLKIFKGESGTAYQRHDLIMVVSRGMVVPAKPNALNSVLATDVLMATPVIAKKSEVVTDVLMAPVIIKPPEDPRVVSP